MRSVVETGYVVCALMMTAKIVNIHTQQASVQLQNFLTGLELQEKQNTKDDPSILPTLHLHEIDRQIKKEKVTLTTIGKSYSVLILINFFLPTNTNQT